MADHALCQTLFGHPNKRPHAVQEAFRGDGRQADAWIIKQHFGRAIFRFWSL